MKTTLFWFRKGLRLHDNAALLAALGRCDASTSLPKLLRGFAESCASRRPPDIWRTSRIGVQPPLSNRES